MKLPYYHMLLLFLLPLVTCVQGQTATPTVSILEYNIGNNAEANITLEASIISIGPTETVYNVICPSPSNNITNCFMTTYREVTQGPRTFHYTSTQSGFSASVACELQSTSAASCTCWESVATPLIPLSLTHINNFTQTLCPGPYGGLTYLPVVVTAGIPNGTTLAITPFPTAAGTPWCMTTTTTTISLPVRTSSAGGSVEARRYGGSLWEVIVGGILAVAMIL